MKKLLLLLALFSAASSQAASYSGLDRDGNPCSIEIEDLGLGLRLILVKTPGIQEFSTTLTNRDEIIPDYIQAERRHDQGNKYQTLRTTEKLFVLLRDGIPVYALVDISRALRDGPTGFFHRTDDYGGDQNLTCSVWK